ncbi:hypothetical protein ACWFQT_20050, partial [Cellulosimicrobium cellulans]
MTDTTVTWLTQEAYDRLQAELAHLSGEGRTEIAERIAAARDEGDLKENGGYHAAREEQAKNEARIRELTEKLRNVQVGTPPDDGMVEAGMVVTANIATAVTSGAAQSLALTVTGAPAGVTATINPGTVNAGSAATLSISTTAATTAGSYPLTVKATG